MHGLRHPRVSNKHLGTVAHVFVCVCVFEVVLLCAPMCICLDQLYINLYGNHQNGPPPCCILFFGRSSARGGGGVDESGSGGVFFSGGLGLVIDGAGGLSALQILQDGENFKVG